MARLLYVVVAVAVFFAVLELTRPTFRVHESGAILITGASTGIGKHVALHLVSLGYDVFASVRKEADGEALAKEAGSVRMHPIVLDVTKSDQIDAAVKTLTSFTQQKNVPLVGLVNNAGVTTGGPVEFTDIDAVKKMYDVNVFGLVELTQKLLPLIRTHQGRIVNVGSVAGKIGMPSTGHYASSKFAVEGLTDALRRELVGLGVSVSIIEPAYVSTAIGPKGMYGFDAEQIVLDNRCEQLLSSYNSRG